MVKDIEHFRQKYKVEPQGRNVVREVGINEREETLERISQQPTFIDEKALGEIYQEWNEIQDMLIDLNEQEGQVKTDLNSVMGKDKYFTVSEFLRYQLNSAIGRKRKAKAIKRSALRRKGDTIEFLTNLWAEVIDKQYETAERGLELVSGYQEENIGLLKQFDVELVKALKEAVVAGKDRAIVEHERDKLVAELNELDEALGEKEKEMFDAKAKGDLEAVANISAEMTELLDYKHQVLDGRVAADEEVSDVRREILQSAETIQAAKGAVAAAKMHYTAINGLIDSYHELVVKYTNAKEFFIPNFRMASKIAQAGHDALRLRKTLIDSAIVYEKMMNTNRKIVSTLGELTFKLLKTPLIDVEKTNEINEKLGEFYKELQREKDEWTDLQQRMNEAATKVDYTQQT